MARAATDVAYNARTLARWLLIVAALVIGVAVVGAITRLTESGLSITEWQPVAGALPPLTDAAWDDAFAAYKRVPQYAAIHAGMSLADFKTIFFWEWAHRLLARSFGLAFALPLAWFWLRGRVPAGYKPRLLALLALGALQATVGWWMVQSGLLGGVAVSHFRLTIHLVLALTLMSGLIWTALDLLGDRRARLSALGIAALAVVAGQVALGAMVAGLRAGHAAHDWPLMNGALVPAEIGGPGWASDPFLWHFVHRWWAWAAVAMLIVLARRVRALERRVSVAIHAAVGTQVLLGIATVMAGVPIWLAVAHQAVGALVVAVTIWGAHVLGCEPTTRPVSSYPSAKRPVALTS